jgi:uncharacterized protein YcbK (DUF882 family)
MGDLTKNISASELVCNCGKCGQCILDDTIIKYAQMVFDECADIAKVDKVLVTITSGNRCKEWNKHEGGKPTSRHLKGQAIDFMVKGFTDSQLLVICGLVLPVGKFYAYSPAKGVVHLQLTC